MTSGAMVSTSIDWPAIQQAVRPWRLRLRSRQPHGNGVQLGLGPGASLEFHDHRAYQAGDDLRHLDWGALARNDQLLVRRYRQEVAPQLEILLDTSASMAWQYSKAACAIQVTAVLAELGQASGCHPKIYLSGDPWQTLPTERVAWQAALARVPWGGIAGLAGRPPPLRPGSERWLISDGLDPQPPVQQLRPLAAAAGHVSMLRISSRAEINPELSGPLQLQAAEGGSADIVIHATTLAAYHQQRQRHCQAWQEALHGQGSGCHEVVADQDLVAIMALLRRQGVVEPA